MMVHFYRLKCVEIPNAITHRFKASWIMTHGIPYVIICVCVCVCVCVGGGGGGGGGGEDSKNKMYPSVLPCLYGSITAWLICL